MAIRHRRGNQIYFDPNKLVAGEMAVVLDQGKLYFCYGPGNTKQLLTEGDVQAILEASPEAYAALLLLISDLEGDPSEITNILSNISALQADKLNTNGDSLNVTTTFSEAGSDADIASGETHSTLFGKILKSIKELRIGKINTSDIVQTDATNNSAKVPSSAVTYAHGQAITSINNNLSKVTMAHTDAVTLAGGISYVSGNCYRKNKRVFLQMILTVTVTADTITTLGTVGSTYTPASSLIIGGAYTINGGSVVTTSMVRILNGTIALSSHRAGTTAVICLEWDYN